MFGIQVTCNYCTRKYNGDLVTQKKIQKIHGSEFIRYEKVMMQINYVNNEFKCHCKICGQRITLRPTKEKVKTLVGWNEKNSGIYPDLKTKITKRY